MCDSSFVLFWRGRKSEKKTDMWAILREERTHRLKLSAHARQVPSPHGDGGEGKGAAGRDGFHSGGGSGGAGGARALQAH